MHSNIFEVIQNGDGLIIAHRTMVMSLEHRYNSRFLPCRQELLLSQTQIKYIPKNRYKDSRTAFYDKPKSAIQHPRQRQGQGVRIQKTEKEGVIQQDNEYYKQIERG
jgi:hypothetical protein